MARGPVECGVGFQARRTEGRFRRRKGNVPHVVIEGTVALEEARASFEPIFQRDGDDILKIRTLYVSSGGEEALLDTLVVESGHRQHFLIQVRIREEGGATIRLLPLSDPEKTDGVKRALAQAAARVRGLRPSTCSYGATNIQEFLIDA